MTMPSPVPPAVTIGLRALIPGIVRTFVPLVIALLVKIGFADLLDNRAIEVVLTLVVTMAYYAIVRVLERSWSKIGWLLGYPAAPVYVPGEVVSATSVETPPTTTTTIETVD